MDEALILPRLLVAVALCAALGAHAQSLQDPTRPPPLGPATADGAQAAGPQLQSVLIARQPGGRHVAVIDGDTVRQGELWRGARVARIAATEVELVRGKERQVLRLPVDEAVSPSAGSAVKPVARLQ
jgi:MSHA biogenesis protein MshK